MRSWNLLLCTLACLLKTVQASEVRILLDRPPPDGSIVVELYDSANTFGDLRDPVRTATFPIDGRTEYTLADIPPGRYALLVFLDKNKNGLLDKNFIGIPREALGFSNNYQPKGPPSFTHAVFSLPEGSSQYFDMALYRPLGQHGLFGIGPGVIVRSSPYRGYKGVVYQVIPSIIYTGERLQWFGPRVQYGLLGSDKLRLAATGEYRIGPYKEDKSDYLDGMGNADDMIMFGLAVQAELPGGIDLSLGASGDLWDRTGGNEASIEIDKQLQWGILRVSPGIAINWMDSELAENDFGVPLHKATADRPAYRPDASHSLEAKLGLFIELSQSWLIVGNVGVEWLDSNATDSPIVEDKQIYKSFVAANYLF